MPGSFDIEKLGIGKDFQYMWMIVFPKTRALIKPRWLKMPKILAVYNLTLRHLRKAQGPQTDGLAFLSEKPQYVLQSFL